MIDAATCEAEGPFGMFPMCENLGGSLFLVAVYGYALLKAAGFISDGSELLLEILSPGLVGGLLLPILGAVPDAAIIVASGLGASKEDAQDLVSIGMGTLAGSTVMLLTIAWGGSLWAGRCDIDESRGTAIDKTFTPGRSFRDVLANTGVTTDADTVLNAKVMIASSFTFLVVQIPASLGHAADSRAQFAAEAVCLAGLVLYCIYQVTYPVLQGRKMRRARERAAHRRGRALAHHAISQVGGLLVDGKLCQASLDRMFQAFDDDKNGWVDTKELKMALVTISLTMKEAEVTDEDVAAWLKEFDNDKDGHISQAEFSAGMTRWVIEQADASTVSPATTRANETSQLLPITVNDGADEDDESDDEIEAEEPMTKAQITGKATLFLAIGMGLVALFADPMVGAVSSLSRAAGLPSPFFAAFVLTPFASNASELVSSIYFASKRKKKNISLTFSQVYGAVTMNNTLCLGLFMMVMRTQELEWVFTAETLTIMLVTLIVGGIAASGTTFRTSLAIPVLAIYPLSVALVCFLDFVLGWS